ADRRHHDHPHLHRVPAAHRRDPVGDEALHQLRRRRSHPLLRLTRPSLLTQQESTLTERKKDPDAEPDVALDLLAEDAQLREAIGEPTGIRIPGGEDGAGAVISVPQQADWPHIASRLAANGAWDAWAKTVLSDEDFAAFQAAQLRNYQLARLSAAIEAASGISAGKKQP